MDFFYREKTGQQDSPMREALAVLSAPAKGYKLPPNPLGFSDDLLASIRKWNAMTPAERAAIGVANRQRKGGSSDGNL